MKYVEEMPNELNLSQFVIDLRDHNLSTTTCNISITTFNSFLTWMKEKNLCKFSNGKPFKLPSATTGATIAAARAESERRARNSRAAFASVLMGAVRCHVLPSSITW
jgi:hypothetical protein